MILGLLDDYGLSSLQSSCLKRIDPKLISLFVERWHPETTPFHIPFVEMMITIDKFPCPLHLSIMGDIYDHPAIIKE